MAKTVVKLEEQVRTTSTHPGGQTTVVTDLPKELGGIGQEGTPTDLFSVALGACMLTMMGMVAAKQGFDLGKTEATVLKTMGPNLTLSKFTITITSSSQPDETLRKQIESSASHCPIHRALSSDVQQEITFQWGA